MKHKATTDRARELRQTQSNAEGLFWSKVRNRQLGTWKFKRQVPIGPYVVDFYVDEARVIIELDGGQHGEDDHFERDQKRDAWLEANGYTVLRFWNNEVFKNLNGVLDAVLYQLDALYEEQNS